MIELGHLLLSSSVELDFVVDLFYLLSFSFVVEIGLWSSSFFLNELGHCLLFLMVCFVILCRIVYRRCWSLFCTIKVDMWSSSFFLWIDLVHPLVCSSCWLDVIFYVFMMLISECDPLLSSCRFGSSSSFFFEYWLDVIFYVSTLRLKFNYDPLLSSSSFWALIKRWNIIV